MPNIHLLDDMQLFVAIVQNKNLSKTAEQLGLAKSTLSLRLQRLEQAIGLPLLHRTTRKLELTEAGALYFNKAVNIIAEAENLHLALDGMLSEPSGLIKLSVPIDFAYQGLAERLPEFLQRYPKISLDIDVNPRRVDLISEQFDVAFRAGESPDSNLISRPISRHEFALYASPAYLAVHGEPETVGDLQRHSGIAFDNGGWQLFNGQERQSAAFAHRVRSNNLGMGLRLALGGMGLSLLPDIAVKQALAQGTLRRVLPAWHGGEVQIYAITATRLIPQKTQVLIEFMKEKLAE